MVNLLLLYYLIICCSLPIYYSCEDLLSSSFRSYHGMFRGCHIRPFMITRHAIPYWWCFGVFALLFDPLLTINVSSNIQLPWYNTYPCLPTHERCLPSHICYSVWNDFWTVWSCRYVLCSFLVASGHQ
jgi:hypothetical protein